MNPVAMRDAVKRKKIRGKDSFMAVHQIKISALKLFLNKPGKTDRG
jgi:hypothetical protein